MDKLDKLPPKDVTPLKSTIAQGIISNTVFQIGWNGMSFMIGLLIRHYALIFGIPAFVALSAGVVAFFLLALSYNLIMRRRDAKALSAATAETLEAVSPTPLTKPTIEILSPFDNDEVGLFETVRGHVFPPEQMLQVVVFADDGKWYPQRAVSVKGSSWSVRCQFGNLDNPSGGSYKVVAILGDGLKGGMWYRELPTGTPKSNIISVHRPEATIEQKLSDALKERDEYKNQLQTATNAFTDMEGQVKTLTAETQTLRVDMQGKKQQMKEVQRERDRHKEEAQGWKDQYDEEHNAALRLKTLNDQYEKQIGKLNSDAEEARKEKLAAASNLNGVETDRNNYRTWFNELAWLKPAIKEQQRDISNHVQVLAARPCVLDLKARVVIIDLVIRNDSFFDIAIKGDAVSGRLSTENKGLLHDPAKACVDLTHRPLENLKPTQEATVAIKQPLLKTEAEDIEDAVANDGGCFWLGNLNIPISVQNAEPLHIDSKPLRINSDVEHVYFREFGALTFDGEVITPRELLRDVEALPFPERARIYRELSKAYGESLWRLNEAKEKKDPEDLAQESINRNTKKT